MELVNLDVPFAFYISASPVFALTVFALVALLLSVSKSFMNRTTVMAGTYFTGLIAAIIGVGVAWLRGDVGQFLGSSYTFDSLTVYSQLAILILAVVTGLLFHATYLKEQFFNGEIISIFFMTLIGMLVMVSTNELISLFIGLELASIGLYSLIGYINQTRFSVEGAVKYLILGSFASGFMLFGFALLYAGAGSMQIADILKAIAQHGSGHPWFEIGGLFAMVGFGFKLALAPFHLWAPDAYESAPTGLTAFMATAVKIMVVAVMLRFLETGMDHLSVVWGVFFMFVATLSAIIGNIMALVQSSLKRMLAYSSVAHAGYMAIALCAISKANPIATSSILFYLVVYSIISLMAFAILMWLENQEHTNLQIDDLAGLATKHPWAAFGLAAAMFAFAGIPPTAGFMGKLFLFNAALMQGFYGLVVIGVIGAVISAYYYLRVIVRIYMSKPAATTPSLAPEKSFTITCIVSACFVLTMLLGTFLPNRAMFVLKDVSSNPARVETTVNTH